MDWHQQHCEAANWEKKKKSLLNIMKEGKHTQITDSARATVAGLEKFGLLDKEPKLAAEMREMIGGNSVSQSLLNQLKVY